ncbi:hypothetical protein DSL92_07290 [Billgrantia gudaonensis]|uniref:Uncharacterized protein n=1 Tax=Billgrantia gudaonensis TaxID=376427 RepID=A0A432JH55_9GAMM|nr:hypothetical protein DSL92_07290 [Halomonas gudaonensis]
MQAYEPLEEQDEGMALLLEALTLLGQSAGVRPWRRRLRATARSVVDAPDGQSLPFVPHRNPARARAQYQRPVAFTTPGAQTETFDALET